MRTPLGLIALESMRERARSIRRESEFHTDAGTNVELGPVSLSGDVDEAVFIEFATETVQPGAGGGSTGNGSYRSCTLLRTFTATAVKRADPKCEKGVLVEWLLADLKRALFIYQKPGLELNGKKFAVLAYVSSRLLPRADGNEFEAVELTGSLLYTEGFGDPYASR